MALYEQRVAPLYEHNFIGRKKWPMISLKNPPSNREVFCKEITRNNPNFFVKILEFLPAKSWAKY